MNFYRYCYFRIYEWYKSKFGVAEQPEFTSLLIMSLLLFINLFTIGMVLDMILPFSTLDLLSDAKIALIGLSLTLIGVCYFYLMFKGRSKAIISHFSQQAINKKKKQLADLYIVGSVVLCIAISVISLV